MARVVAVIPARAGSKRLEGKNKKVLAGKPLICWTIDAVLNCKCINEIIVTTDDEDIIHIGTQYNGAVRVLRRPAELAEDTTPILDVVLYHLQGYENTTIVVLLQATSPLRVSLDITKCMLEFFRNKCERRIISGWYQYPSHEVELNGAVYVQTLGMLRVFGFHWDEFTVVYRMPEERSVDVDTLENFKKAERYLMEYAKM